MRLQPIYSISYPSFSTASSSLGGFTSSAIISLKTGCREVREGLKIGIGGWLISTTLFLPWTENPTIGAVIMILIMFLTGSYLGFKTSSRRMKTKK
jgi:hypothetical protein